MALLLHSFTHAWGSSTPPPPPPCVALYGRCQDGSDPCCSGICAKKNRGYSQCRPSCPDIGDWECAQYGLPPPPPSPPPLSHGTTKTPPKPLPHASDESEEALPVGSLAAALDPESDWFTDDDAPACVLRRIGLPGEEEGEYDEEGEEEKLEDDDDDEESVQLLEWSVPSSFALIKSSLGQFGLNLCGAAHAPRGAHLPRSPTTPDSYSIDCRELRNGNQPAYLVPTEALKGDGHSGCRTFGGGRASMSLIARSDPHRGVELAYKLPPGEGLACPPVDKMDGSEPSDSGQTTLTVVLRCDEEASEPVLKDLALKNGCDLQVEFTSEYGCPKVHGGDGSEEGEEGEGGDEGEDDNEPRWSGCLHGESGCELSLLLDPQCNPECANDECFWDNGACHAETMGCLGCDPAWLADGECDDECFTEACKYDNGDCIDNDGHFRVPERSRCDESCPASWLGDGECDPVCNLQACLYDNGDCTPGSCLIALPLPVQPPGPTEPLTINTPSELSMGMPASSGPGVNGQGPPAVSAGMGTVWYDLSKFGLQSLTIGPQEVSLSDGEGGLVDEVHLSLAICEPLSITRAVSRVDACTADGHPEDSYNRSELVESRPIGVLATSRGRPKNGEDEPPECLVAGLGAWDQMDKQLLDPLYPTQGVQLEFGGGTPCEEADETTGDGTHRTRLNLVCSPTAETPQRIGWRRYGCLWEFSIRFAGACAKTAPPSGGDVRMCSPGCLPTWKGDGMCDRLCNTTACEYDGGDCRAWIAPLRGGEGSASATSDGLSIIERWICGVKSSIHHRHGHGGGGGGSGACTLNSTEIVELPGRIKHALDQVTPDVVIWIALGATLLVLCLCGCVTCLCCQHASLQRTNRDLELRWAQYQAEARLASMDEAMSAEEGAVANGDGIQLATVHRIERAPRVGE